MFISLSRGERFQEARKIHNRNGKQTLADVYAATGISASKIKDLEDDDKGRGVDYRVVAQLARHYGVTSDYLLGLSEDPKPNARAADQLGISAAAVAAIEEYAVEWHIQLSDLLTAPHFIGVLASLRRLKRDVENIRVVYQKGWKQNIKDSDLICKMEQELETHLGYPAHFVAPKHMALYELNTFQQIALEVAKDASGYNQLTYQEAFDSSLDADPTELRDFLFEGRTDNE